MLTNEWDTVASLLAWDDLRNLVLVCKASYAFNHSWFSRTRFHGSFQPSKAFKKLKVIRNLKISPCVRDVLIVSNGFDSSFFANLTSLTFADAFNLPVVIDSLTALTYLKFGRSFNKPIAIPPNVEYLIFGKHFDQRVIIPASVKYLTFGKWFNEPIVTERLVNLKSLTFGEYFDQPISLNNSPDLTSLTFGYDFDEFVVLNHLTNLTQLTFGWSFSQLVNIPSSVTRLALGCEFNQHVKLPLSVTNLTVGPYFQHFTMLTPLVNLRSLNLEGGLEPQTLIPTTVTHLQLTHVWVNGPTIIPSHVTRLTILDAYDRTYVTVSSPNCIVD